MKKFLLSSIKAYQKSAAIRNPILKTLFLSDGSCKYSPTCSEYTYQAIKKYGSAKGTAMGLKRIARCHPFAKGGFDPVP